MSPADRHPPYPVTRPPTPSGPSQQHPPPPRKNPLAHIPDFLRLHPHHRPAVPRPDSRLLPPLSPPPHVRPHAVHQQQHLTTQEVQPAHSNHAPRRPHASRPASPEPEQEQAVPNFYRPRDEDLLDALDALEQPAVEQLQRLRAQRERHEEHDRLFDLHEAHAHERALRRVEDYTRARGALDRVFLRGGEHQRGVDQQQGYPPPEREVLRGEDDARRQAFLDAGLVRARDRAGIEPAALRTALARHRLRGYGDEDADDPLDEELRPAAEADRLRSGDVPPPLDLGAIRARQARVRRGEGQAGGLQGGEFQLGGQPERSAVVAPEAEASRVPYAQQPDPRFAAPEGEVARWLDAQLALGKREGRKAGRRGKGREREKRTVGNGAAQATDLQIFPLDSTPADPVLTLLLPTPDLYAAHLLHLSPSILPYLFPSLYPVPPPPIDWQQVLRSFTGALPVEEVCSPADVRVASALEAGRLRHVSDGPRGGVWVVDGERPEMVVGGLVEMGRGGWRVLGRGVGGCVGWWYVVHGCGSGEEGGEDEEGGGDGEGGDNEEEGVGQGMGGVEGGKGEGMGREREKERCGRGDGRGDGRWRDMATGLRGWLGRVLDRR
ncbi:hypothetical protein MMC13_004890 [Lambiella insularis]|nr:hypothetical protein [Lambiella insularis]